MTLLRMLAFKPAAAGDTAAGGGKAVRPNSKVASSPVSTAKGPVAAEAKPNPPAQSSAWSEPDWNALVPQLDLKGAARMLAINCAYLRREGATLYFSADSKAESMLTSERRDSLAAALSQHYGETLRVNIELDAHERSADTETPVEQESRLNEERYAAAKAALESDPNVQTLKTMFGAELKSESIEPITPTQSD